MPSPESTTRPALSPWGTSPRSGVMASRVLRSSPNPQGIHHLVRARLTTLGFRFSCCVPASQEGACAQSAASFCSGWTAIAEHRQRRMTVTHSNPSSLYFRWRGLWSGVEWLFFTYGVFDLTGTLLSWIGTPGSKPDGKEADMARTPFHSALRGLDVLLAATSLLAQAGFLPCSRGRAVLASS